LKAAIRDDNPVIFLEHESLYGKTFDTTQSDTADVLLPLDKAIVMREGIDITITAFSITVDHALRAADVLHDQYGISAEVINLISLRPIDVNTVVNSIRKTSRILNIEEGWGTCGIGAEIATLAVEYAFDYLDCEPTRISTADVPMPYAKNLEELALPSQLKIIETVKSMCNI
jgi:pyruvate dehydrogenase E1 component beta subunit